MNWRRISIGIAITLVIVVAAGELVARYGLGLGDPPLTIRDPEIDYLFKPGVYHRFGNTISYNAYSMRADEIAPTKENPAELRVLVMGDSVINGGVLTDDSELATRLAQQRLTDVLDRPVWVGNVSAGSWGPGNLLAYSGKYGWFDADIVVLVLSSHDIADIPDFRADLGPDFPGSSPLSALFEGLTRYFPRYLPTWGVTAEPDPTAMVKSYRSAEGAELLTGLLREAAGDGGRRKVYLLHHPERLEREQPQAERSARLAEGSEQIEAVATAAGVSLVPLGPYLDRVDDASPYRDDIHVNEFGQRSYADAIVCVVQRALEVEPTTCA